jgi:hypothetical protein
MSGRKLLISSIIALALDGFFVERDVEMTDSVSESSLPVALTFLFACDPICTSFC